MFDFGVLQFHYDMCVCSLNLKINAVHQIWKILSWLVFAGTSFFFILLSTYLHFFKKSNLTISAF